MGLFKKKKENLSELPKPSLDLGIEKLKFPDLPKFPEPELKGEDVKDSFPPLYKPTIIPRSVKEPEQEMEETGQVSEKPLFIKIERYEDAMKYMEDIKNKIKDASQILDNLNNIKNEEDNELKKWQDDLLFIKSKLMRIDKNLFGA